MKNLFIYFIAFLSISFKAKHTTEVFSITINVNNLRNSKGVVQFSIYNKEGSIPDEKYKNYYLIGTAHISNKTATITFDNLPKGWYAINILHDENENGKIDKGFILPKEGIGFSNYTTIGLTNRPKFSKAKFEVSSNINKEIKAIYF
ncbi:MAG: DUF2141 domain-containing protein [Flavobacteriaceae bacterium]|nr:DUF2141 domain-containing protein [Flavobacteriaceae bacterium]